MPAVIDAKRAQRVQRLRQGLTRSIPGSRTELIGSLGAGTEDQFSDIDLRWYVGDRAADAIDGLGDTLARVGQVESLRFDPDTAAGHRLAFVRFTGWPLFSRVDLEILGDCTEVEIAGSWSRQESALMNAVGAVKAELRGRGDVEGLLARGFVRIDAPDPGAPMAQRMRALVDAAASQDPDLSPLVRRVHRAVDLVDPGG